ncbi:MAG: hypothetical protein ACUVWX_05435 [Kiritimatiellia bacterium]
MEELKQNRVSRAIWNWADLPDRSIEGARRRSRAMVRGVVMVAIAAVLGLVFQAWHAAVVALVLCLFVLATGLWLPTLFEAVEKAIKKTAQVAGTILTWLLLVPFFCLFFVPARFFLWIRGIDPLQRRFPSREPTYWQDRPTRVSGRLERQF